MSKLIQIQEKLKRAIEIQDKAIQEWVAMDKQDPMYIVKGQEVMDLHKGVISLIKAEKEEKSFDKIGDYWDGKGKYQEAYDKIWKEKVPAKGESDIQYVEAVRCIGRLIYEYGNNGNCNASETRTRYCDHCDGTGYEDMNYDEDGEQESNENCYECGGDCYVIDEYIVSEYYDECLQKIADYTKEHKLVRQVRDTITKVGKYSFSPRERAPYNLLCDAVMRKAIGL